MTAVTALHSTHPPHLFGDRADVVDFRGMNSDAASSTSSHLVVSPYISPPHLLDLDRYSKSSQLFAKALTIFQPTRSDYATAEYTDSFSFQEVIETLRSLAKGEEHTWNATDFYVVSFRSQLSPDADPERLFELDAFSHQEAMASGGLLKYWYGVKDENRRNLATCKLLLQSAGSGLINCQAFGKVDSMREMAVGDHGMQRPELQRECGTRVSCSRLMF